jgi:hypothetical protein
MQQPGGQSVAVVSAMRRLEAARNPGEADAEKPSSIVRQLYTLALLNREDAKRRLFSSGMPPDINLAHQPPSALALARPSSPSAAKERFRATPRPMSPPRKPEPVRRSNGPRFGAVSASFGRTGDATMAIAAARERVGTPGSGYGVPSRTSRPPSRFLSSAQCASSDGMRWLGGGAPSSLPARPFTTAGVPGGGRPPTSVSVAAPAPPPLCSAHLERQYPVKHSTLPARLAAEMEAAARRSRSDDAPQKPVPRSTVRELLEPAWAQAAAATVVRRPTSRPAHHAQPRSTFDAWAAAEADVAQREQVQAANDEMQQLRLAAEVGGAGTLGALGA